MNEGIGKLAGFVPCSHPAVRLDWVVPSLAPSQLPRLYNVYKEQGIIDNFEQLLANVFAPLFEVTADPNSHPQLHLFLKQVGRDLPSPPVAANAGTLDLRICLCGRLKVQTVAEGSYPFCALHFDSVHMVREMLYSRVRLLPDLGAISRPITSASIVHPFLPLQVVGFDLVDDESKPERRPNKHMPAPREWTSKHNPSFAYYAYYTYANLYSLNKFREARGMNTFAFRPHSGETHRLSPC